MRRIYVCMLLVIVSLCCISIAVSAQKKRKSNPHAAGEDIYKHYMGTIGNRRVVFDVIFGWQGGSNYGGSYFYYVDKPGAHHFWIGEPPTFEHTETLTCDVVPESSKPGQDFFYDRSAPSQKMKFIIRENKLTGKWHSADKKRNYNINLTEDYPDAIPLDIKYFSDSSFITNSENNRFKIEYNFIGVVPAANANRIYADFINNAQLEFLGDGRIIKHTMDKYLTTAATTYFSEISAAKESIPASLALNEKSRYASILTMPMLLPVYNDDGFLVLKKSQFAMMPDGKPDNSTCSYLCLDVRNQRRLFLEDMIIADNDQLSMLLEKAFRKRYKLPNSKKLSAILKVNKIPGTTNVMLSHKGLTFSYDPGQMLNNGREDFTISEVNIFVPYTDLKDLLKPDFKKRIGM